MPVGEHGRCRSGWRRLPTHESFVGFKLGLELFGRQSDVFDLLPLCAGLTSRAAIHRGSGLCPPSSPFCKIRFGDSNHAVDFNIERFAARECIFDLGGFCLVNLVQVNRQASGCVQPARAIRALVMLGLLVLQEDFVILELTTV